MSRFLLKCVQAKAEYRKERRIRIEKETAKLNLLKTFLPEQLSEEQIATKLKEAGITSDTSMGEAMKIAKSLLDGQADGATLSKVVKQLITK